MTAIPTKALHDAPTEDAVFGHSEQATIDVSLIVSVMDFDREGSPEE
jgi:hypothetical protein